MSEMEQILAILRGGLGQGQIGGAGGGIGMRDPNAPANNLPSMPIGGGFSGSSSQPSFRSPMYPGGLGGMRQQPMNPGAGNMLGSMQGGGFGAAGDGQLGYGQLGGLMQQPLPSGRAYAGGNPNFNERTGYGGGSSSLASIAKPRNRGYF